MTACCTHPMMHRLISTWVDVFKMEQLNYGYLIPSITFITGSSRSFCTQSPSNKYLHTKICGAVETNTTLVHLQRIGIRLFSPAFERAQGQLTYIHTDLITPKTMTTQEK